MKTVILDSKVTRDSIIAAAQDKKANYITSLDLRGKTIIADFFIICSGTSNIHIRSIADGIMESMEKMGVRQRRIEGYSEATWVLLDYSDVIVHIMSEEQRNYYGLEKLWTGTISLTAEPPQPIADDDALFPDDDDALFPDDEEIVNKALEIDLDVTFSPAEIAFVNAISGDRTFTREERIDLETQSLARYFAHRRHLLRDSLTSEQVAEILGTTRQTPHDRVRAGTLLAVEDGGRLRFPRWQFDPAGPQGVVSGLPSVIQALSVPSLTKVKWLQTPSPYLEGRTPLEALKSGEIDRVLPAAYAVEAA